MSAPEAMLEPRVIVQGFAQFRGEWPNLPIPKIFFSSPTSCALVSTAGAEDQLTKFTLILGELRVQLTEEMSFHPDLSEEKYSMNDVLVIEQVQGFSLQIKVMDDTQRAKWSRAVRNAIAETIFQDAFVQPISALKLSKAVFNCSSIVPSANCHLLRARRLTETLLRLDKALKAAQMDPTDVPMPEIEELNRLCGADPLLKDLQDLKQLNRLAGLPAPQQQLEEQQARQRQQLQQLRQHQQSPHRPQRSSSRDVLILPSASQESFVNVSVGYTGSSDSSSLGQKEGRLSEAYYYRPRDSIRRGRRKREDIIAKTFMPNVLLYYLIAAAFLIVFGFGFLILAPRLLALNPPSTALVQSPQYAYPQSHVHSPPTNGAKVAETKSTTSATGLQAKWAMAAIRKGHNEALLEAQAASKSTQEPTTRRAGGFFGTNRGSTEPLNTLTGKAHKSTTPAQTSRRDSKHPAKQWGQQPTGSCHTPSNASASRWWWFRITPMHEWSLVRLLQNLLARVGKFVRACVGRGDDRVR